VKPESLRSQRFDPIAGKIAAAATLPLAESFSNLLISMEMIGPPHWRRDPKD
jgi:hypothetical protein